MSLKLRGGVWHFRKMINGHIISRSTKTSDKKLAEQIAAKFEHEAVKEIVFTGNKPITLHAAIEGFLKARKGTGGHTNACVHMKHWMALPDVPMKELKLFQVQEVVQRRRDAGAAHNTICVTVGYWNALQNFCTSQGWTPAIKLEGMRPEKTRIRVLSVDEETRILAAIDPAAKFPGKNPINIAQRRDNQDLFLMLLHLGCRLNEAQKMKWSQVDFHANTVLIHRSKGGVDSQVVMSNKLRAMLERRRAENQGVYVFPGKALAKVNTSWINEAVERAAIDQTSGKVTLHTLRHTFATRVLKAGLSVVEVQGLLGHKNLASTTVYMNVQANAAAVRAAEIMNAMG
ncbi:site-specific integrase [Ramlibacter sp. AN1015]|uniref:tyrosine-type recombinase/integrase n=1 Tax=Ramlibacter sp. AN1015 TaxID=3133428 RepID=UPI0030C14814